GLTASPPLLTSVPAPPGRLPPKVRDLSYDSPVARPMLLSTGVRHGPTKPPGVACSRDARARQRGLRHGETPERSRRRRGAGAWSTDRRAGIVVWAAAPGAQDRVGRDLRQKQADRRAPHAALRHTPARDERRERQERGGPRERPRSARSRPHS